MDGNQSRAGPPGRSGAGASGRTSRGLDPDLQAPVRAVRHRAEHTGALLRFLDWLTGAFDDFLALAVPVDCICCGAEDSSLCPSCAGRLRKLTRQPFRAESGAPALVDVAGTVILPVVAAGVYRDELAQGLLSFKRLGQHRLGRNLGSALAAAVRAANRDACGVLLVPVPTSTAAYVRRGFSPVHLLLKHAAPQLPGLAVTDVLRRSSGVRSLLPGGQKSAGSGNWLARRSSTAGQKGLGRGARSQRVRGSMTVASGARAKVAGRPCIIVDDVLTTGATLGEAARALHRAGARVRGAVVLAATRPPDHQATAAAAPDSVGNRHVSEKNKPGKDE